MMAAAVVVVTVVEEKEKVLYLGDKMHVREVSVERRMLQFYTKPCM